MIRLSSRTRHRRAWFLLAVVPALSAATGVMPAAARPSQGGVPRAATSVIGSVFDSLASAPLVGARVQMVSAEAASSFAATAVTDSAGRFFIDSVAPGMYMIGFLHPVLDSLGVESPVRQLRVANDGATLVTLAIPSPARVRAAVCEGSVQGGVLLGHVRDLRPQASKAPIRVTAEWMEVQFGRDGLQRRSPRRTTETRAGGWFALCGVPNPGSLFLFAHEGGDSTAIVEAEVPATGVLRHELYLGKSVAAIDTVRVGGDSAVLRQRQSGNGRITGVVLTSEGARPLPGAQVTVANGPATRTNERGEFVLSGVAEGTRAVEVRALGYYPVKRAVNVVERAPSLRVSLATLNSVLDTMKIRATRTRVDNLRGFRERALSGIGRYLTPEMIERRMPQFTADIFLNQGGVKIEGDSILVRGIHGYNNPYCAPTFYLDGMAMRSMGISELNLLVTPREIRGVEIYAATQVPAVFSDGLTGCGVIAIWTR